MSECCGGDSGLGAVGIPTETPSGGEGFVRSVRWVDLRIGPGGDGTELEPYHTVAVGLAAIPSGGTVMVAGGDASAASSIDIGSKSTTIRGLGGQDDDGGRTVELPPLTYAITTGTQELTFHEVSVVLTHTGTVANLTELHFYNCPNVSLLADGDEPVVHWMGGDDCTFSGEGGEAHFEGGTVNGYDANGSNPVTLVSVHVSANVTSAVSIALRGHCTFGAGVTITAPSITIDLASHASAVAASVAFSSTPALQAVFAAPVDIGSANAAGSANSIVRSDHVHDLPFTPVQEALAAATGSISVNSQKITNLATPTSSLDAVNKAYADAIAVGLKLKNPAVAVAVANQATMSGTAQTIDGVALNTIGQRVLLTAQTTATQNGLWVVASGAWTRPADFATGSGAALSYVPVTGGTVYAGSGWLCTSTAGSDVVDTDNLTWGLFTQPATIVAGAGLTNTGNTIDVNAHADGSIVVNSDDIQVGVIQTANMAADSVTDAVLRNSAGFSVIGKATTGAGNPGDIVAGTNSVLGRNGPADLAFGQVQTGMIATNAISDALLRDSAGFSVIGKATTGSGDPADITAGTDTVFGRSGSGNLGFAQLATGQIANDAVTYAKMQNVSATSRVLGRITSGAGDVEELTGAQVLSLLPAPGSTTQVVYNNGGAFDAASGITVVASETALAFGSTPGTAGAIRMTSDTAIVHRNNGNTADILSVYKDSTDALRFGQKTGSFVAPANMGFDVATSGAFAFFVNGSSEYTLDASGMVFGGNYASFGGTPSDQSEIRMASGTSMSFRNAGNSANILGIYKDPSDSLRFGQPTGSFVAPANMGFDVATSGSFTFYVNAAAEYTFNASGLAFGGNYASFGTTPASSGSAIRLQFYSSATPVITFRNGANTDDVDVLTLGRFGNDIDIGDPSSGNGSQLSLFGTIVNIKPDNATTYLFDNGVASFGTNELNFDHGGRVAFYLSGNSTIGGWIKGGGTNAGIEYDTDSTSESHTFYVNSSQRFFVGNSLVKAFVPLNMDVNPINACTYIDYRQIASPGNPSTAGEWRIYSDSGGNLLARNNAGTVRTLATA